MKCSRQVRSVLSLIGVAVLTTGALAACGDDDDAASDATVAVVSAAPEAAVTEAPAETAGTESTVPIAIEATEPAAATTGTAETTEPAVATTETADATEPAVATTVAADATGGADATAAADATDGEVAATVAADATEAADATDGEVATTDAGAASTDAGAASSEAIDSTPESTSPTASSTPSGTSEPATPLGTESSVPGSSVPGSSVPGDVCADTEALRESVAQLRSFDISRQRVTVLGEYLADVRSSLETLRGSGGEALRPAIDSVGTSIEDLQTAIDDGAVRGIVSAVTDLVGSAQTLLQQVSDGPCPTVSSSIPSGTVESSLPD